MPEAIYAGLTRTPTAVSIHEMERVVVTVKDFRDKKLE